MFAAFPLTAGQPDGLTRLGISSELLKEHGIDANKQGLTIGMDVGAKGKGPEKKVGGIDMSLISAGEDDDLAPITPLPHGGIVKDETIDGDRFITYADGYLRGEFSDGSFIEKDKNGTTIYAGTIMKYTNPDADTGSTVPTPEQEKNVLRLRGAVIRTIDGWSVPELRRRTTRGPQADHHLCRPPQYGRSGGGLRPSLGDQGTARNPPRFAQPGHAGGCDLEARLSGLLSCLPRYRQFRTGRWK